MHGEVRERRCGMNAHLFAILDRVPAPTWAANDDEAIRDSNPADLRFLAYGAIAALLLCLGGMVL
jgi:PAS domain-containing protein